MLNNFVLYSSFCISMISFLKVPRLVTFRDAALRNTPIAIAIAITQLVIAIFLMLSVKVDYFDIPLAAQLGLLVPFASMNALLSAHFMIYMPPLDEVPRTEQNVAHFQRMIV